MGKYAKTASHHFEKIRHFYDHAGEMGFSQAKHYYEELSVLIGHADRSKDNKSDVLVIKSFIESAAPLMEEMKRRGRPPG